MDLAVRLLSGGWLSWYTVVQETDMGFVICFLMNGISKVFFGIRMGNCLLSFNKSDPIASVDRLYYLFIISSFSRTAWETACHGHMSHVCFVVHIIAHFTTVCTH